MALQPSDNDMPAIVQRERHGKQIMDRLRVTAQCDSILDGMLWCNAADHIASRKLTFQKYLVTD